MLLCIGAGNLDWLLREENNMPIHPHPLHAVLPYVPHRLGGAAPEPEITVEQICREHATRIYNLARRMLDNDADAEDVTQEVLLQVVRKLDGFRRESDVTTWLHRIVVNTALAHRRKCARRPERQLPDVPEYILDRGARARAFRPSAPGPDQQVLDRETRRLIEDAIATLPQAYRNVYVLADLEGLPNADVCAALGLGLAAVKSRLHRARHMLREALAPHYEPAASSGGAAPQVPLSAP
jgi:RNA polymerase sigma-70 factor (ECF subfamily)